MTNSEMVGDRTDISRATAVRRLLHPRSIAIVGVSSKTQSASHILLGNLISGGFRGDIHLVGRSGGVIDGRPVLQSVDQLPEGVDLAVLTVPAAGVCEQLEACGRRKVCAATVFAAGYAEVGARAEQDALVKIAADGGTALLGPNCMGYTNFVEGFAVSFAPSGLLPRVQKDGRDPAFGVISHSGGVASHICQAIAACDVPASYSISTGNEAGLGLADFLDFLVEDDVTRGIILYVEQFRDPAAFLASTARARVAGKPVLLMHPGRSAKAQAAASSHTGALAGDYAVMRTHLAHAGVALIDTLDELIDATEILARFPDPPTKGPGMVTFSGAFCAMAHDFCDDLGLDIPSLSPQTTASLKPQLPAYVPPNNPLDLATQSLWQPELMRIGPKALLDDPAIGSLVVAITVGGSPNSMKFLAYLREAMEGSTKPVVVSIFGGTSPLPPKFLEEARAHHIIISRSSERSLRAIARLTFYGRALERANSAVTPIPFPSLPSLGIGTQPEWLGKKFLAAAGIRVPEGTLATTVDEAIEAGGRLGYPVAMKAQAASLAHKTDAGGVSLNIADDAALRRAWKRLHENLARVHPTLRLDGVLVEKMVSNGLRLVVGAKCDPQWGPVVMVGLGGIWIEALKDIRLLPTDLCESEIIAELEKLRAAKLLHGFRGTPPVDIDAVAKTASIIGRLMLTLPEIAEIDINPLFVHNRGEGVTAADALIITS
jgi:acyl-CoA synthetase (NDP forming)